MIRRVGALVLVCALPALALAGCGGSAGASGSITVFGASSLEAAVTDYADSFSGADVKASFAGSDQLAAEIRQGAEPDVFLSADTEYPDQLYREGLVEKPRVFAGNRLVIAVPAGSEISSLDDLAQPGVKIVVGAPSVPVGAYTRTVLDRLPAARRKAIEANIRSEEPEVGSVVAKLEQGAADAGFVYVTDARAAGSALMTVPIPPRLQPDVAYGAAVVKGSGDPEAAREFLDGLLGGEGAADLRKAGFLPPP
jgi:molybdate transport system substrate-binding protein